MISAADPWIALRLQQMRDTVERVASTHGETELIAGLLERMQDVLGLAIPCIVLVDAAGGVQHVALPEITGQTELSSRLAASSWLAEVIASEYILTSKDLHDTGMEAAWPADVPIAGPAIGAPMRLAGRTMGALLGFRARGARPFADIDELAAATLALQTAAHVSRARELAYRERTMLIEERDRVATELVTSIVPDLEAQAALATSLAGSESLPAAAAAAIADVGARLTNLARGVADYAATLSDTPSALRWDLGRDLAALLGDIVPAGIDTILRIDLAAAPELPPRVAADALFVIREAVTNAVRYASATRIAVDIRAMPGQVVFAIQDNGAGLDVNTIRPGLGLLAMRNRIDRGAGVFTLVGLPGMGALIHCTLPTTTANNGEG